MLKLPPKELKAIAKIRGINGYESMPEDKLLSALKASESETNFDKTRTEKITDGLKKLEHKFSKPEIKGIKKNLYEIENKKSLSASREEDIKEYLLELEENLFELKTYYDKDEYKGTKSIRNLFDLPIAKDYCKPIITKGAFNSNYIRYESMRGEGKDKNLSIKNYLNRIKPYLSDIINNHKTQGTQKIDSGSTRIERKSQSEWKIQLTMLINFIFSKEHSDETRIMPTRCDNIEITMGSETDEIIEELFKSLQQRYQKGLEESMDGSDFTFDGLIALYYDLNTVILSRGESYIDSPEWLKNKKATVNPKNNDDNCFQYDLTAALKHEQIKNHPERISNIKPFIDQCNCKEINFPASTNSWKKFESNNESIALNIFYVPYNAKEIGHAFEV